MAVGLGDGELSEGDRFGNVVGPDKSVAQGSGKAGTLSEIFGSISNGWLSTLISVIA